MFMVAGVLSTLLYIILALVLIGVVIGFVMRGRR
ncbi:hypothetical protein BH20ACT24_BH20ACT24_08540 [soil metagenome]